MASSNALARSARASNNSSAPARLRGVRTLSRRTSSGPSCGSANRPNAVKLPLLLQTARVPDHPLATEAKEILELYLEEDYGTNWDKWQQEIERWLKENPD